MDTAIFTYVVIFKSQTQNFEGPISFNPVNNGTMHLFDEELYPTLDALEFLMHMPRHVFDLHDIDENLMSASHDSPHNIIIVPDNILMDVSINETTMVVLTNDCSKETKQVCEKFKPVVGIHYSKELNNSLLNLLWNNLYEHYKSEKYPSVSNLGNHILLRDEQLKALPTLFLSCQFHESTEFLSKVYNSQDLEETIIHSHWNYLLRLNTLFSLGKQGVTTTETMAQLYHEQRENKLRKLQSNVIITFPGLPKRQKMLGINAQELSVQERRIIRIIGVHRAIARTGILIELPCATEMLFQKYDHLEECCKNGTNNNHIWRCLNDLGKELKNYFNYKQIWLLKHAQDITVFSDFPIGISILTDDEVPLQCYKSISYQPLTPLTRRLQHELIKKQQYYLGESCKIAIAECVPNDAKNQMIYKTGECLYWALNKMQTDTNKLILIQNDIANVDDMRKFINDNNDADVLYISAHGCYERKRNVAGIIIGKQFWMADENLQVPPIVILSACHTAPRGFGCVTIADMFLRNGAQAVLGSFVPVNAMNNMILMTRLFTYIMESQSKSSQYKTLSDAWSGIVATNAIHEIMATSKRFKEWMHEKGKNGRPRIVDFQLHRCNGRLRREYVYSDTIAILKEMLEEEGMIGKFDNIISQNDYFPESFFYQLLGSPENIFLYNEIFDEYIQKNKDKN